MTFIDFFAGIGGFRHGLEMAGHKCVGYCEWDRYASISYRAMHTITEKQREYLKTLSLNERQKEIALANKAPLLTNIQLLNFNRRNWKVIITQAMNLLEYKLKNQIIVCRADVKLNGITQRIGVSVIVVHNEDNVSIKTISVFRIEDRYHLIKSYARKAPKGTAKQVADIYAGSH